MEPVCTWKKFAPRFSNSERDRDLAFRFAQDTGVSAMIVLALTLWPLGEIKRALAIR